MHGVYFNGITCAINPTFIFYLFVSKISYLHVLSLLILSASILMHTIMTFISDLSWRNQPYCAHNQFWVKATIANYNLWTIAPANSRPCNLDVPRALVIKICSKLDKTLLSTLPMAVSILAMYANPWPCPPKWPIEKII